MVLCNTCYLIKTHARQLWKQRTKNPKEISETTITYDLAHYTFWVFTLLQWINTASYYNHAKGYTAKGREGRGPARWQRDWLKEQIAATPQDFSPSSVARERELVGGLEVTAARLWTTEARHWMLQMVSVGLVGKQTTWDLFQEPVVMVTGLSANQKCLHPGGSPPTYVPVSPPLGIRRPAWWIYAEKGRDWSAYDCDSLGTQKSRSQSGHSRMKLGLPDPPKAPTAPIN